MFITKCLLDMPRNLRIEFQQYEKYFEKGSIDFVNATSTQTWLASRNQSELAKSRQLRNLNEASKRKYALLMLVSITPFEFRDVQFLSSILKLSPFEILLIGLTCEVPETVANAGSLIIEDSTIVEWNIALLWEPTEHYKTNLTSSYLYRIVCIKDQTVDSFLKIMRSQCKQNVTTLSKTILTLVQDNTSVLSQFTATPIGRTRLQAFIVNDMTRGGLLTQPNFWPILLSPAGSLPPPMEMLLLNRNEVSNLILQGVFSSPKTLNEEQENIVLENFLFLDWLTHTEEGLATLGSLLTKQSFKNKLADHSAFITELLTQTSPGVSAFSELSQTTEGLSILESLIEQPTFINHLLQHAEFIPTLLARTEDNQSTLYFLLETEQGQEILEKLMEKREFKARLLINPAFIPTVIARGFDDSSAFYWLVATPRGRKIFKEFLKDVEFKSRLLQDSQFIPTLLHRSNTGAILYWLIRAPEDCDVLENLIEDVEFRNRLLQDPEFVLTLLTPTEGQILFHWFITSPHRKVLIKLLEDVDFKNKIFRDARFIASLFTQRSGTHAAISSEENQEGYGLLIDVLGDFGFIEQVSSDPNFIETLLTPPSHAAEKSTFYSYITHPMGRKMITALLQLADFKTNILKHRHIVPSILARFLDNTSVLSVLTEKQEGVLLLANLLRDAEFKVTLFSNSEFIPTLFARLEDGSSVFHRLMQTQEGQGILEDLLLNEEFLKKVLRDPYYKSSLLENSQFISMLLSNRKGVPPLYYFLRSPTGHIMLWELLQNPQILAHFLAKPEFIHAIVTPYMDGVSLFHWLLIEPQSHGALQKLLGHEAFMNLLSNNLDFKTLLKPLPTLFYPFLSPLGGRPIRINNIFSAFLSQENTGRIIKQLLDNHAIRNAILASLEIPPEARHLSLTLLRSHAGLLLIEALEERKYLLKLSSLRELYANPQVQHLIRLRRIQPEWFLFAALHETNPYDTLTFFLNQAAISPWSVDNSGRYLSEMINNNASLSELEKTRLLQLVSTACRKYSKEQKQILKDSQKGASAIELDDSRVSVSGSDSDNTPQEESNVSLTEEMHIEGINDREILEFHQAIQWILSENLLKDYHRSFRNLAINTAFRNAQDFLAIYKKLTKELLPAMKKRVAERKIPPFNSHWSMSDCTQEVFSSLEEMINVFEGKIVANYQWDIIRETSASYCKILGVPLEREVHAPTTAITSLLKIGTATHQHPLYDAALVQWGSQQLRMVSQNVAYTQLNAEQAIYDRRIAFIRQILSSALAVVKEEWQTSGVDLMHLFNETPWGDLLTQLNASEFFGKEITIREFLQEISVTVDEEKGIALFPSSTKTIEQNFNRRVMPILQRNFNFWYEQQDELPHKKILNLFSELLWLYLTDNVHPSLQTLIDNLLQKLPSAMDANALIKYTIMKHHEALHNFKIDQFLKPIPNHKESFFSMLVSNPFDAAWLFAYNISVSYQNRRIDHIAFVSANDEAGIKDQIKYLGSEGQLNLLKNTIEKTITEPGTLFFWLYYLKEDPLKQQDPSHRPLFLAIQDYLSSVDHIEYYDSLLPVLYDMQKARAVPPHQKMWIKNFLTQRIEKLLLIQEKDAYFDTSCTLIDPDESLPERTERQRSEHPWLTFSKEEEAFIYNREPTPLSDLSRFTHFSAETGPSNPPEASPRNRPSQ